MDQPPFMAEHELYHKLYIRYDRLMILRRQKSIASVDSMEANKHKTYLPGQPQVQLQCPNLGSYLESDLVTEDLNKISPYLWLVAKQDSSHISSLTHQVVRGRQIIITEQPRLHLVWIYDRIFVKPIPKYLLSHAFWEFYLVGGASPIPDPLRQHIKMAALGFLRSYWCLIKHKSDFLLATRNEHRLVPRGISHADFINFISAFECVTDGEVSPRYRFGELRLTRLNFWSKIFLRRFTYQKVYGQYGAYFARYYGPVLFIFGTFTVILSAMQVALAVQQILKSGKSWITFAKVSRWFSILAITCGVLISLFLFFLLIFLCFREIVYAINDLHRKAN